MNYLQGSYFDVALGRIIEHAIPSHHYKSIHDLFNPELFYTFIMNNINKIPELSQQQIEVLTLKTIKKESDSLSTGYIELKMLNFNIIIQILEEVYRELNMPWTDVISKESLFRMVKDHDLDELQRLLELTFELIIKNIEAVQFMTSLAEELQESIKNFVQKAKNKHEIHSHEQKVKGQNEDEKVSLQKQILELQALLANKEHDLYQAQNQVTELMEQIHELSQNEAIKQIKIEELNKRLISYEEMDSLFQEKDEQISKLQNQVADLQLNNRLLQTDLSTQRKKIQTKIADLQKHNGELLVKSDRLMTTHEILMRQKQDLQSSHKKVVFNLKDKNKSLSEKINELQNQLVEVKISKELRDRQFNEVVLNFESLKSNSIDNIPLKRHESLDRIYLGTTPTGSGKQIIRLEEELNEIDKFKENAFEEEIMMFQSSEDNLKKVQQIIAENIKLKQRLNQQDGKASRDLRQQNQKLKKRLAIMRKRNDEIDSQRRQQIQIMVSAFDCIIRKQ